MRVPIIAGNWKMNNTIEESIDLINNIDAEKLNGGVEGVLCVPFTAIKDVKKALEGTNIKVGAQNMHWDDNGAWTGEISPHMLKELEVDYVILGHSERRQYFNETDETVNKKMKKALEMGIKPILCVGESLEEREAGEEKNKVKDQVVKALEGISSEDIENLVIAYEPIWAIGTGKTASSDDANDILQFIRETIDELYEGKGSVIRLQYGGSVNPENVEDLMSKSDVDGALVGGASLKAESFMELINF